MTLLLSETHKEGIIFAADRQIVTEPDQPDWPGEVRHVRWARKVFSVDRFSGVVGFYGWAKTGKRPRRIDSAIADHIRRDAQERRARNFPAFLERLRTHLQELTRPDPQKQVLGFHAAAYMRTRKGTEHPRFYCFRNYDSESGMPSTKDVVEEWWHPRLDFLAKGPGLDDPEVHAGATLALLSGGVVDTRYNGDVASMNLMQWPVERYVRTYAAQLKTPVDSIERLARLAAFKVAVSEVFWTLHAGGDPPVAGPIDVIVIEPGKTPRPAAGSPFKLVRAGVVRPPHHSV